MNDNTQPEATERELTESELDEVRGGRGFSVNKDKTARGSNERSYSGRNTYSTDVPNRRL